MDGCETEFYPKTAGQVRCERHVGLKGRKVPACYKAERTCSGCGVRFVPSNHASTYCSRECRFEADRREALDERMARYGGPRTCVDCKLTVFAPKYAHHIRCTECGLKRTGAAVVAPEKRATVPCGGCKHGRKSSIATFGWECSIERWSACGPLYHKRLYVRREDG